MSDLSSFTKAFSRTQTKYSIVEFAEKKSCLGIQLFPQQRFLLNVLDKQELDNKKRDIVVKDQFGEKELYLLTEKEFYSYLYDDGRISLDYDTYQNSNIVEYLLSMGRRSTKSTTISVYLAYKLYEILSHPHPQELFNILRSDKICITLVALGMDNASILFSKLNGIIGNASFFKPFLLEPPLQGELRIWTQNDLEIIKGNIANPPAHSNSIIVSASSNSGGLRGKNNIFCCMDEVAHFNQSANSTRLKPLDEEIYQALTPSVSGFKIGDVPFGKTLLFSSPGGKAGLFFREYENAFKLGAKSGILAIRATTPEMNPSLHSSFLKSEYTKNPGGYNQEFLSNFGEDSQSWLLDYRPLYRAIDMELNPLQQVGKVGTPYYLGADYATERDGTAIAITHFEREFVEVPESMHPEVKAYYPELFEEMEQNGGRIATPKYVIDYFEVRYAGQGVYKEYTSIPIETKDGIIEWTLDMFRRYPIRHGIHDQWSGTVLASIFKTKGLRSLEMLNHSAQVNDAQYKLFLTLLNQHQIKWGFDQNLIREIKALKSSIVGQGFLRVDHPSGGHNDLFTALARSLYLCWAHTNKDKGMLVSIGSTQNLNHNPAAARTQKAQDWFRKQMLGHQNSLRNPKNMFPNRMK